MKLYYRISDSSYKKEKLIGTNKEICLMNFVRCFNEIIFGKNGPPNDSWVPPIKIIADRCDRKTNKMLLETGLPVEITDLGNAGSLIYSIKSSISDCADDEVVYFCEDDYLHKMNSSQLIEEGIKRCDYLTLYDHPDKYTSDYNGGEFSKVIKTESTHWRYTISTCMTFATKIKTLKEDIDIWEKYTKENHPHDHQIFTDLNKEKNRRLAVCIPGSACHTDLEYSGRVGKVLIDSWAIEMMINQLMNDLKNKTIKENIELICNNKNGWQKLVALDALYKSL